MSLKRKFKGKTYYFDSVFSNSSRAYHQAASLRKAGNKAKVKKEGTDYEVWVRSPEDK